MNTTTGLLTLGAVAVASALGGLAPQDSQQVARLTQQVDSLRNRLDFEIRQLQQRADRVEARLDALDRGSPVPVPPIQPIEPTRPPATGTRAAAEFTARRFVVEDGEGRIRAVLAVSDIYGPMLGLLDEEGALRVLLSQQKPDTAGVSVLDSDGTARIGLLLEQGEVRLRVVDDQGNEVDLLNHEPSGGPPR